jgi:DNA polymerase-3 subunit gamma/tau
VREAREAIAQRRSAGVGSVPAGRPSGAADDRDSEVDPENDSSLADSPLSHADLLVREFGAEVIEERPLD